MKFVIIGWLCSPFLHECVPFEGPKIFNSKIVCKREANIVARDMKKRFNKENFPTKISITCKEKQNGIGG